MEVTNNVPARAPVTSATPYTDATQTKKHQPGHIKRPMNHFMVWSQSERRRILREGATGNINHAHISKQLGAAWKKMTTEQKLPFIAEAERLKHLHCVEYPDYKYRPKKKKPVIPKSTTRKPNKTRLSKITRKEVTVESNIAQSHQPSALSHCFQNNGKVKEQRSEIEFGLLQGSIIDHLPASPASSTSSYDVRADDITRQFDKSNCGNLDSLKSIGIAGNIHPHMSFGAAITNTFTPPQSPAEGYQSPNPSHQMHHVPKQETEGPMPHAYPTFGVPLWPTDIASYTEGVFSAATYSQLPSLESVPVLNNNLMQYAVAVAKAATISELTPKVEPAPEFIVHQHAAPVSDPLQNADNDFNYTYSLPLPDANLESLFSIDFPNQEHPVSFVDNNGYSVLPSFDNNGVPVFQPFDTNGLGEPCKYMEQYLLEGEQTSSAMDTNNDSSIYNSSSHMRTDPLLSSTAVPQTAVPQMY